MITEKDLGKNIADNFRLILKNQNMTIPNFAKKIGCSRNSVNNFLNRLEEGKGGSLKTICKWSKDLGVSPYQLFYEIKMIPRKKS